MMNSESLASPKHRLDLSDVDTELGGPTASAGLGLKRRQKGARKPRKYEQHQRFIIDLIIFP